MLINFVMLGIVFSSSEVTMIGVDQMIDIKNLHQQGHSIKAISRLTGHARNTVRKVLRGEHTLVPAPRKTSSKLDAYKPYLQTRYRECALSAVRLCEEIQAMGYEGSVATVRRYLRTLKPAGVEKSKLTVRFETPPGKQGQVDWMHCGRFRLPDGRQVNVYGFVMVLSYSRAQFVHFTTSMQLAELIRCHQLAFDYFGGWPQTLLYDNMKQVKLSRRQWNEAFVDFTNHYGIVPKTHQPYRPRTKGKVERLVRYVRDNFLAGRVFDSLGDLNAQALHWLTHTAQVRVHGTTGQRPVDRLHEEQSQLTPVTQVSVYQLNQTVNRTVNREAMVCYQGSRYSVPPDYAGQQVQVNASGGQIQIALGDTVIAEHPQAVKAGQCKVDKDHLKDLWRLSVSQTPVPADVSCTITFEQQVQTTPLHVFEAVLS